MVRMSGYSDIMINHSGRKITTVKNGNIFYIWFEDVRDISTFKTTGYIVQKVSNNPVTIIPANKGGVLPENFDAVIREIMTAKPVWERELPDM